MTTAPDMLSHYGGVPVASSAYTNPWTTAYFVDGTNGTAGAGGLSPGDATATINQAVTLAGPGDVIYVRQLLPQVADLTEPTQYTDNIVIPVTKYGLSIIGTGNNPHQPFYCSVKPGSAGYGIQVLGSSFLLENMAVNRGSATTGVIYLGGDNSTSLNAWGTLISNCHIRRGNSAANAGIKTYAGSYQTIYHCYFTACDTGISANSGGSFPIRSFCIDGCTFQAENADNPDQRDIYVGGVVYQLEIKNCNFHAVPALDYINAVAATTYGVVQNCYFGSLDATCSPTGSEINVAATVFVSGCFDDGSIIATT